MKLSKGQLFVLLLIASLFVNLDHGVIPACTSDLKQELEVDDLFIGILGSLVFAGLMAGSLVGGAAFTRFVCKKVILWSLFFVLIGLLAFPLSGWNHLAMALAWFISGFFQEFLVIFFPVWIDSFGGEQKTIWLTYIQLSVVLGIVFGYALTAICKMLGTVYPSFDWRLAFYVQFVVLLVIFVILYYTEEDLLSTNGLLSIKKESPYENMPVFRRSLRHMPSMLTTKELILEDDFDEVESKEELIEVHGPAEPMDKMIKSILTNKLFIITMLTQCSLYFIINAIQYWISDYMVSVMEIEPQNVFKLFVVISTTAPALGLVLGGKISSALGGYQGPNAITFCLICSVLAFVISLPIPYTNSTGLIVICFWFWLFFGASMMPTLMGLMLQSLDKTQRGLGNALAQFFFCLLGYIPSPVLYGLVVSMDTNKPSWAGMKLVVFWAIQGNTLLLYAWFDEFRTKRKNQFKKQIDQIEQELQFINTIWERDKESIPNFHVNKEHEKELKFRLENLKKKI